MSKEQGEAMTEQQIQTDHFPERAKPVIEAINRIKGLGGEEYEGGTEKARRNPVKSDTGPILTEYARHATQILEMGTAYGLSALYMALASKAQVHTVEFDPTVAEQAQETLDQAGVLASVFSGTVADAAKVLDEKPDSPKFDLVFIDHNKTSYLPDFQAVEAHLADNAVVLADNVLDRWDECGDLVEYLQGREDYEVTILPTQAGLMVAERVE